MRIEPNEIGEIWIKKPEGKISLISVHFSMQFDLNFIADVLAQGSNEIKWKQTDAEIETEIQT